MRARSLCRVYEQGVHALFVVTDGWISCYGTEFIKQQNHNRVEFLAMVIYYIPEEHFFDLWCWAAVGWRLGRLSFSWVFGQAVWCADPCGVSSEGTWWIQLFSCLYTAEMNRWSDGNCVVTYTCRWLLTGARLAFSGRSVCGAIPADAAGRWCSSPDRARSSIDADKLQKCNIMKWILGAVGLQILHYERICCSEKQLIYETCHANVTGKLRYVCIL